MQHNDIDLSKPLLLGTEAVVVARPAGYVARVRRTLMPYKRVIQAVNATILLCYIVALAATHSHQNELALEKRTVLNGTTCPQQRKQLNVFMAAFFGGMFAADQFYAKNWQLAVPKLLFFLFGGPIAGLVAAFTGLGLHGAWWLIDVVMWGVGYYTTHTHWGNPTKGCAVKGW